MASSTTTVYVTTLSSVPGHTTEQYLMETVGMVSGSGRTQGLKGSAGTVQQAYEQAERALVKAAERAGAQAVIGVRVAISEDNGGNTVLLVGNAVTLHTA